MVESWEPVKMVWSFGWTSKAEIVEECRFLRVRTRVWVEMLNWWRVPEWEPVKMESESWEIAREEIGDLWGWG